VEAKASKGSRAASWAVGGVATVVGTPRPAKKEASLEVAATAGRGGLGEAAGKAAPTPGEPRAEVEALAGKASADEDGRMGLCGAWEER
jgi:hypothetical protein